MTLASRPHSARCIHRQQAASSWCQGVLSLCLHHPGPRSVAAAHHALPAAAVISQTGAHSCGLSHDVPSWSPRRPGRSRRPAVQCAAASSGTQAVTAAEYSSLGPYQTMELNPITINVGGTVELPVTAQLRVLLPVGAPSPAPLVIISAGFLLNSSLFESYAKHLASWGYAAVLYDLNEVMEDVGTVGALRRILDTCMGEDPQLRPLISRADAVLLGHSRGGKLSCLLAAELPDRRIKGLMLLDPVDNTPMTPPGEGYPSALPGLSKCTAPPRSLPVLVVGAGSGGDMIPQGSNFQRFVAAARGPVWSCTLQGAGHLGFLDKQIGLLSFFSSAGDTPDDAVRLASKVAIVTWLRHAALPWHDATPARRSPYRSCANAVTAAGDAVSRIVRGAVASSASNLDAVASSAGASGAASGATAGSSASGSVREERGPSASSGRAGQGASSSGRQQAAGGGGAAQGGGGAWEPVRQSYEELMRLRARELKAMLVERGVRCDDVFEKEDLARRLLERCGVASSTSYA